MYPPDEMPETVARSKLAPREGSVIASFMVIIIINIII